MWFSGTGLAQSGEGLQHSAPLGAWLAVLGNAEASAFPLYAARSLMVLRVMCVQVNVS